MNLKIKLGAYAALVILAAWFAWGFYSNYSAATKQSAEAATNDTATVNTNAPAPATNPTATTAAQPPVHAVQGSMIGYLGAFVVVIIGLGLLIAHDVTQYVGGMAVDALLDDRGEGARDPEYEKAEQVWANGKHMEAIEMMRDFLKKHPREQYAALRIAEIYEKDLRNYLAAALEYEEVLKKKLPAERWGWAAIHLCNLYSKLGQQDKTRALLQRIVDEYPKTAAAKKARNRLGLPEPEEMAAAAPAAAPADELEEGRFHVDDDDVAPEFPPAPPAPPAAPEPPSNLPPGFRPKK